MDRDQRRRLASPDHRIGGRRDLLPIGRPEARAAAGNLGGVDGCVARHDGAIGIAHDERGIVEAPVRVDDQARIGGEHGRRRDEPRERAGCFARADVIGDVTAELVALKAERPELRRNGVRGVIADDERSAVERARNPFEGAIGGRRHPGPGLGRLVHRLSHGASLQPAIVAPPSTTIICPVMNDPALEAR